MNLQDKLAEALCDRLESHPNHALGTPCQERAKKIMALVECALAAGRTATIEECKRAAQTAPTFSNALIGRGKSYAVKCIDNLPHDRSALDDVLAQTRREQRKQDAQIATAAANERATAKGCEVGDWIAAAILAQED